MPLDRHTAQSILDRALLGDLPLNDRSVQDALADQPDLAAEFTRLQALQHQLGSLVDDAEEVEATARRTATHRDTATVRTALGLDRPRRWSLPLLLAALVMVAVAVMLWQDRGRELPRSGMLEGTHGIVIDRSAATWSIDPGLQLGPLDQYRVTLEVDGAQPFPAKDFPGPIVIPQPWQQAIDAATSADLVVEVAGIGARRVVRLR